MANTDVQEYQQALATLKTAAAPFLALTKLYEAAAPLLAVVNHEAELKASVEALKADVVEWTRKVSDARATEETALADARAEHERYEAEYVARRDALRAVALKAEADRDERVAAAKQSIENVTRQAKAAIDDVVKAAETERDKVTTDLVAFQQAAAAERERITAQTAALQAHLDDLKGKVSAALA